MIQTHRFTAFQALLLLWNLSFGLLPSHLLRFTNTAPLLARMEQEPAAWWLLERFPS